VAYRWRSACYAQRFERHALDTPVAMVAVHCKVAYFSIEAVKLTQKSLNNIPRLSL
jgi:hypothetical protein